eukprot:6214511-Pleurochrysis_carterae.AAC.1
MSEGDLTASSSGVPLGPAKGGLTLVPARSVCCKKRFARETAECAAKAGADRETPGNSAALAGRSSSMAIECGRRRSLRSAPSSSLSCTSLRVKIVSYAI